MDHSRIARWPRPSSDAENSITNEKISREINLERSEGSESFDEIACRPLILLAAEFKALRSSTVIRVVGFHHTLNFLQPSLNSPPPPPARVGDPRPGHRPPPAAPGFLKAPPGSIAKMDS
ncbi:hypothetical protein [Variovorax sp. SRS16]|uniref:hypothetical protein n=1 Tax=Variovorax sp. SRS16 TaxID=282217 RepID=UPI0013A57F7E|nr:hypothetical protein [Variovorax sp. SRS16]